MIANIIMIRLLLVVFIINFCIVTIYAGTKDKPHLHNGKLVPYTGNHIGYELTAEETKLLNNDKPVTVNTRDGSSGRGIVIQDVNAPIEIVMYKIMDLANYPRMVPKVKKGVIYEEEKLPDGTHKMGAEMQVSVFLFSFVYFLQLELDPNHYTFRWTLDYRYNSDFDDNIGQWQVMPHPTKKGWSRVVYSCEAILFSWIPELVVTWVTKTALVEATTWVKKESEKMVGTPAAGQITPINYPDISSCFTEESDLARYDTSCIDNHMKNNGAKMEL